MRSKYGARKVVIDGITFDSAVEGDYYLFLKLLKKAGEVTAIACHPKFTLQPGFKKHGRTFKAMTYTADFGVTWADGRRDVRDVKGMPKLTDGFRLRRALYSFMYEEPLIVVRRNRDGVWVEYR